MGVGQGASSASSLSFLEPATEELGNSNVLLQQACSVETDFFPSIATIPNSSIDDPPQFLPLQDNSNYSGDLQHGGCRLHWHRSMDHFVSQISRGVANANPLEPSANAISICLQSQTSSQQCSGPPQENLLSKRTLCCVGVLLAQTNHMRFAGQMAQPHSLMGRLELSDIIEEMPFEIRVLETALEFVRGSCTCIPLAAAPPPPPPGGAAA